jgi:arginine exporter protein ArgO
VRALADGILAGLGIAVPVGPIAVLLIDLGIRRGFAPSLPAALGAASADLTYAAAAAILGGAAASALRPFAEPLRWTSVAVLLAVAALRLRNGVRSRDEVRGPAEPATGARLYAAFLGLTLMNPVTVAYFAALIVVLEASTLVGPGRKALFVTGAFVASASWQTILVGAGSLLHHRLSERGQVATGVIGATVIVAFAVRLALG